MLDQKTRFILKKYSTAIGGLLLAIGISNNNNLGYWAIYYASFLRNNGYSNVTVQEINNIADFWMVFLIPTSFFTPEIIKKFGSRIPVIVAGAILPFLTFLNGYVNHVWIFFLTYGVAYSLLFGAIFGLPTAVAWTYFIENPGMAGGICFMGYSLSPLVIGPVITHFANPDNIPPKIPVTVGKSTTYYFDSDVTDNVPFMFLMMGIVQLAIIVVAVILIQEPNIVKKEDIQEAQEEGKLILMEETKKNTDPLLEMTNKDFWKIVITRKFWPGFVAIILAFQFPLYILYNFKNYGLYLFGNDRFAAMVGEVGSSIAGVSKIGIGLIIDYFGPRKAYKTIMILSMFMCAIMQLLSLSMASWTIGIFLCNMLYGFQMGYFPGYSQYIFGTKLGAKGLSLTYGAVALCTICVNYIGPKMLELLGYSFIFGVFYYSLIAAAYFIFTLFLTKDQYYKQKKKKL